MADRPKASPEGKITTSSMESLLSQVSMLIIGTLSLIQLRVRQAVI